MDKFVLIDGNSLINRAFYATPPLSAPDGTPTNAVYAFMNMLIKIIGDLSPKYLLVAFDRKEPTFRHKIYTEYKGTRKPMPEDLAAQIPVLKNLLDDLNICHYECPGIEADDIIGTFAKRYDLDTVIYTGDKDSFQLVDETTKVYFTRRGISDTEQYTNESFVEKYGFKPVNIIDLKALMGDASDNIPGVKGIGEKTALSLVAKYTTIENLYDNVEEITGKLKEKLLLDKDNAYLSKTLATINTKVDISLTIEDAKLSFPFTQKAKATFSKLGFVNLLRKQAIFAEDEQLSFGIENELDKINVVELQDEKQITSYINSSKIALIIGDYVSFYNFNNTECRLKVKQTFFDEGFDYDQAIKALDVILKDSTKTVIVYHKNQILHQLALYNIAPKCKFEDVALMKYLVDYTGKDELLTDVFALHNLSSETQAYSLYKLYLDYVEKLTGDLKKLYYDLELPLSNVLYDMEKTGFKVDIEALNVMSNDFTAKITQLSKQIYELAGEQFNLNSPKQLSNVLFEKMQLTHGKKTKSGYSTDSAVLEELADKHPIIPLLLKYRRLAKLQSTYIEGFRPLIDKKTGLVHTTFNQVQTSTGRLSSREPNLQNIPIRDEEGREIRRLFSARESNRVLIDADYSQIELRLLAAFSNCKPLIEAFNKGEDIHTATASMVFGVPIDKVDSHMRRSAKAVNFGIVYGISDYGLAKNLKISPKVAGGYIDTYFKLYPEVKEYMAKNVDFVRKNGYAVTHFGRKRYIREINSTNYNLRTFGERAAMNMPLQGAAADIMKFAMLNVFNRLNRDGFKSKLILQVHDELVIDAYKEEADAVAKLLREEMENVVKLSVPLTVSLSVCENWFDAK